MIKRFLITSVALSLVMAAVPVWAMPDFSSASLTTPGTSRTLTLPTAAGNAGVISLGSAVDPATGNVVEGFAIVHYKRAFDHKGKPHGKPGGGGGGDTQCYGFLSKDARWKTTEDYVLDTANTEGMSDAFVADTFAASIETWDSEVAFDIFGTRDTSSTVDGADTSAPDGKNEVYFGSISESGAIAVTIVWGYFSGPPFARELIEWDMIFDQTDFAWGDATVNPALMDFANIAVHELGHSAGLADLYDSACSEETMYGYATEGEIKKQTLNAGDIAGLNKLY